MTRTVSRWTARALPVLALALLLLPACNSGDAGSSTSGTVSTGGGTGGGGGGSTADTDSPLDVTLFDAQATGVSGQVSLTWVPSASVDAASYRITWTPATGPAQPITLSPASTTSTSINGLADGTSYTITLVTVDTSGNVSTPGAVDTVVPGSSSVFVEAAPHGGIYPAAVQVVFNYTGTGTVRYTTDGSEPTLASPLTWTTGSAPIAIGANTRLKYLLALASGPVSNTRSDIYEFPGSAGARFNKFSGMRISRVGHTATRLKTAAAGQQDDVIVIGGIDMNSPDPDFPLVTAAASERFDADFEHFELGPTLAPRAHHAAAVLPGGLVLVTGGQTGGVTNWSAYNRLAPAGATAGTAVYNAATNTFPSTSSMGVSRYYHAATALYDGRVLVTGGMTGEVIRGPAAIGNESPSTSSLTLPPGFVSGSGIVKGDLVEVVVGPYQVGVVTSFTSGVTEDTISVDGFLFEVFDGDQIRVLRGVGTASAERFTAAGAPAGATAGSMVYSRYGHTATLLDDGTVLVVGGVNDDKADTIGDILPELYDVVTDRFTSVGDYTGDAAKMKANRFFHTATKLKDGKVLIVGGIDKGGAVFRTKGLEGVIQASADLYDPITRTTRSVGSLSQARFLHDATLLQDGRVLVTGGVIAITTTGGSVIGETADLYDPATESFTSVLTNDFRSHNRVVTLSDGRALVMGGGSASADIASDLAEMFIPSTNRFEATAHGIAGERTYGAVSTVIPDGRILITGGQTDTRAGSTGLVAGPVLASAEIYTMSSISSARTAGDMSVARRFHTATRLVDLATSGPTKAAWHGRILVAGGENEDGAVTACDLFNTSTTLFAATAPLKTGRYNHTATVLPDGRVLVTGGGATGSPLASGEIYNPASGTWADTANTMSKGRTQHRAVLIPSHGVLSIPATLAGKVLIMGGNDIDDATAELFDPADNLFKPLPVLDVMGAGRRGFAAAVRTYSKGLARFSTGSTVVDGFGSGWVDAGIPVQQRPAAGDLIRNDADGTTYVIQSVAGDPDGAGPADARITLSAGFLGASTIGFQAYTVVKPYIFVAGGEGGLVATDMFVAPTGLFESSADMGAAGFDGRYALTMDVIADGRILLAGGYASIDDGRLFSPNVPPNYGGTYVAAGFDAGAGMIYHTSARPPNGFVLILRAHSAQVFFPN